MYFNKNCNRGTKQDLKKTGKDRRKAEQVNFNTYLSNLNSPIWAANKDYIYTDTHIRPKGKPAKTLYHALRFEVSVSLTNYFLQ